MTTTTPSMASLLERRHSYERIPRFFFPKAEDVDEATASRGRQVCRERAGDRVDALMLTPTELRTVSDLICGYACTPRLSSFQKTLMKKTLRLSGVRVVDELLENYQTVPLSYDDWVSVVSRAKCAKLAAMMPSRVFLSLPSDSDGHVNGLTVLEYLYTLHRMLVATHFLLGQPEGSMTGELTESEFTSIITRGIRDAITERRVQGVDEEFQPYYELICTRMVVLRHDLTGTRGTITMDDLVACPVFLEWIQFFDRRIHGSYVSNVNRFTPDQVRQIHRQYLQLDTNKNGMLSVDELMDYGKKRVFNPIEQTPTHDFTNLFVTQVFQHIKTFPPDNEMDYKAYIDFTLSMADRSSDASLRYFWRVLDIHKQGFLDAFTIDTHLRELVLKIQSHEHEDTASEESSRAFIAPLRTQVFDLVAPQDPLKITFRDLTACRLGHIVVRLLTDYVAYREYDACEGRFELPVC